MTKKIAILPGDGIGPEIITAAEKVLASVNQSFQLGFEIEHGVVGGSAIDQSGEPLPPSTLSLVKQADAVLLGAVGGPKWDGLPMDKRAEQGLLGLRSELELFANLRPAMLYPQLSQASTLKSDIVAGLDMMIVRELTGGIYFGLPRGVETQSNGERKGFNTLVYTESEVKRIAHVAFNIARVRQKRLCSVDKANVLEATRMWRDVMEEVSKEYADVELSHMYVDNAAMQLVRAPKQFDVMVTTNMFGDILSDCAAMLTGSIGMLPSASLDANNKGMYEPIHGSAPDISGQDKANPLATILSVAMMLRYSFQQVEAAQAIEKAVGEVLTSGLRTADIHSEGQKLVGCKEMGLAVLKVVESKTK